MNKVFLFVAATTLLCLSIGAHASDVIVYTNDFQGTVGNEWSSSKTDVAPIGARQFLGQFCNDEIKLSLQQMPLHSKTKVAFDLFIIRSWDGNSPEWGPDTWDFGIEGETPLIHTAFSLTPAAPNDRQSYPDRYPAGDWPGRTGAIENNTLGYTFNNWLFNNEPMDCVYHFSAEFAHSTSNLTLAFRGSGLQASPLQDGQDPDESWGLDNVVVSVTPVPEPSSLIALTGGLVSLLGIRRRRA